MACSPCFGLCGFAWQGESITMVAILRELSEVVGVRFFRTVLVFYSLLLWLAGSAIGAPQASDQLGSGSNVQAPLQFGLLPYISTRKLFYHYGPLKDYLERVLQRPVIMSTAPDFRTYLSRAKKGEYDLYLTAPHFAALAEQAWGYRRLLCFSRELDGSVVIAKNGPAKTTEDLAGGVVRLPDELAIISFLGEEFLEDHGLATSVQIRFSPSHNNAILSVLRGEALAAVSSTAVYEKMSAEVRANLVVLGYTQKVPHMMLLAGPSLNNGEVQQLFRVLRAFGIEEEGKHFFQVTGYEGLRPITDDDMRRLSPFLARLKQRLDH
jgi:phosphonate transport system substrate-binding protein